MYNAEWVQGQPNRHLKRTRSSVVVQCFQNEQGLQPQKKEVLRGADFESFITHMHGIRGVACNVLTEAEAAHYSVTGPLRVTGESRCWGVP